MNYATKLVIIMMAITATVFAETPAEIHDREAAIRAAYEDVQEAKDANDAVALATAEKAFRETVSDALADLKVGEILAITPHWGMSVSISHIFQDGPVCEDGKLKGKAASVSTPNGVTHVFSDIIFGLYGVRLHMIDSETLGDRKFGLWVCDLPEGSPTTTINEVSLPKIEFKYKGDLVSPDLVISEHLFAFFSQEPGAFSRLEKQPQNVPSVFIVLCDEENTPYLAARVAK